MLFNNFLVEILDHMTGSTLPLKNSFLFASSFNFPCFFVQAKATQKITMINFFFTMCLILFYLFIYLLFFCHTNRNKRGFRFRSFFSFSLGNSCSNFCNKPIVLFSILKIVLAKTVLNVILVRNVSAVNELY